MDKNFTITSLGEALIKSPLGLSKIHGDNIFNFIPDEERVLYDLSLNGFNKHIEENSKPVCFEKAGPREKIFFDPKNTRVAIVTCGGLCPGINNVIRSIVMASHYFYGIEDIIGIPYGYEGLNPEKKKRVYKINTG